MEIQEAVQRLLAAEAELAAQKAVTEALRDRLYQVARARYSADGTIQQWRDTALGVIRLNGAGKPPTVAITDPDEFANHVAQNCPSAVRAIVEVPTDKLEDLVAAADFAGIDVTARVEVIPERGKEWIAAHAAPVEVESGWVVQELAEGDNGPVVACAAIPGLAAVPPRTTLSVTVAAEVKADMVTRALADLDDAGEITETHDLDVDATPPPPDETARIAGAHTVTELRDLCRAKGLRTAGAKGDLAARLAVAGVL